jgi:uncharacterized protein (DUF433 family)
MTLVGLLAAGRSTVEIPALYPYLEEDDISEALARAAWAGLKTQTLCSGAMGRGCDS